MSEYGATIDRSDARAASRSRKTHIDDVIRVALDMNHVSSWSYKN